MVRVAVVGGGIAGLTFAAWLRRDGIDATVYEQADEVREAGAGIQLSPNGVRLLHRLGLGPELARRAVVPEAREIRRWRDGRVLGWTGLGAECTARFGVPYLTLRRSELHECLRAVAPGPIELGRRCVAVRELDGTHQGVELSFVDGSSATADLVVGADGIRSTVRGALGSQLAPVVARDQLRPSGLVVHRGLVPTARLADPRPRVTIFAGPGGHCVWYPVSADWYSLAAVTTDPHTATFDAWHPEVIGMLSAATELTSWALSDRWPLRRWHSRRITLIGDAAHPMLPFGAQGANQAIESAVTLAIGLIRSPLRTESDLTAVLARFARLRIPRLRQVAAVVRRNGDELHLPDGEAQSRRDRALSEHSGLSSQDWLYGYDAEAFLSREPVAPAGRAS